MYETEPNNCVGKELDDGDRFVIMNSEEPDTERYVESTVFVNIHECR